MTPPRCPYHSYAYNEGEPPSQIIAYAIISETKFKLSETKLRSFITWLKDWKSQRMICILPPTMNQIGRGDIGGLTTDNNI